MMTKTQAFSWLFLSHSESEIFRPTTLTVARLLYPCKAVSSFTTSESLPRVNGGRTIYRCGGPKKPLFERVGQIKPLIPNENAGPMGEDQEARATYCATEARRRGALTAEPIEQIAGLSGRDDADRMRSLESADSGTTVDRRCVPPRPA